MIPKQKTWPEEIWLQVTDTSGEDAMDYKDVRKNNYEVTWCHEEIDKHDIKYIRGDIHESIKRTLIAESNKYIAKMKMLEQDQKCREQILLGYIREIIEYELPNEEIHIDNEWLYAILGKLGWEPLK